MPEEVAVPIPEADRIAERQRLQAVPIPDCELGTTSWELAVPISQPNNTSPSSLEAEDKPDIEADNDDLPEVIPTNGHRFRGAISGQWEMAVPISGPEEQTASTSSSYINSTARNLRNVSSNRAITGRQHRQSTNPARRLARWEQAVPISASTQHNPVRNCHTRGWELAVPISGQPIPPAQPDARPSRWTAATPLPTAGPSDGERQPILGTYELAVPIDQSPSPVPSSPSQVSVRLPYHTTLADEELLIDPALRSLRRPDQQVSATSRQASDGLGPIRSRRQTNQTTRDNLLTTPIAKQERTE